MTYSPDTLALNPEFAKRHKRRKTKTPGGKGRYGHVPDSQEYAAAGQYVMPSPQQQLATATRQYVWLLQLYGRKSGVDEKTLASLLAALARIGGE